MMFNTFPRRCLWLAVILTYGYWFAPFSFW